MLHASDRVHLTRISTWQDRSMVRTISSDLPCPRRHPAVSVHKGILGPRWVLQVNASSKKTPSAKYIIYGLVATTIAAVFAFSLVVYFTNTHGDDTHENTRESQRVSILPMKRPFGVYFNKTHRDDVHHLQQSRVLAVKAPARGPPRRFGIYFNKTHEDDVYKNSKESQRVSALPEKSSTGNLGALFNKTYGEDVHKNTKESQRMNLLAKKNLSGNYGVFYNKTYGDDVDKNTKESQLTNTLPKKDLTGNLGVFYNKTHGDDVHQNTKKSQRVSGMPVDGPPSVCDACEVCLQNPGDISPRCMTPKDAADPTGCGGLCQLNTHYCRLLDPLHNIRACLRIRPEAVPCAPGQFTCREAHMCIPEHRRCDGVINCFDMSDERECECDLRENFRCGNALSCVPKTKRCDGSVDCWDASDELNCGQGCDAEDFACRTAGCVPRDRLCDGTVDCEDQSDEPTGCDKSNSPTAKINTFVNK